MVVLPNQVLNVIYFFFGKSSRAKVNVAVIPKLVVEQRLNQLLREVIIRKIVFDFLQFLVCLCVITPVNVPIVTFKS